MIIDVTLKYFLNKLFFNQNSPLFILSAQICNQHPKQFSAPIYQKRPLAFLLNVLRARQRYGNLRNNQIPILHPKAGHE